MRWAGRMNQNVKAAAIVDAVPGITSLTPDEASGLFLMGTLAMGVYADAPSLLHLVGKWNTGSLNNRGDLIGAVPYDDKMARATSTASGASVARPHASMMLGSRPCGRGPSAGALRVRSHRTLSSSKTVSVNPVTVAPRRMSEMTRKVSGWSLTNVSSIAARAPPAFQ